MQVNSEARLVLLPFFKTVRSSSYTLIKKKTREDDHDQELFRTGHEKHCFSKSTPFYETEQT